MTRRGSLAYYLAAWILGCFFMSLAIWVKDLWGPSLISAQGHQAFGILFFYFYGLFFGAAAALVGAFLLRRIMAQLKCKTPSHWAFVGAILAPIFVAILGIWGRRMGVGERPGMRLLGILTFGPRNVLDAGWWLAIPAGAATAYFLCRIQRAFSQQQEPPASA